MRPKLTGSMSTRRMDGQQAALFALSTTPDDCLTATGATSLVQDKQQLRSAQKQLAGMMLNASRAKCFNADDGNGNAVNQKRQPLRLHQHSVVNKSLEKQRQFVTQRLTRFQKMNPKGYADCIVRPALQYFLATVCDLKVGCEHRQRLGLRYPKTPEVSRLLAKLSDEKPISADFQEPNALLSALKEILATFPGGIFEELSEKFLEISLDSKLPIVFVYLHGLLSALPYFLRQFVYLICRSLRNLVEQSTGGWVDAYTDLLMSFTPVLFPTAVGHVPSYLRAARLTLVMVDCCEQVFKPVIWLDHNSNNMFEPVSDDEIFFRHIFASLNKLEDELSDATDENHNNLAQIEPEQSSSVIAPSNQGFYQVVYLDPLSDVT